MGRAAINSKWHSIRISIIRIFISSDQRYTSASIYSMILMVVSPWEWCSYILCARHLITPTGNCWHCGNLGGILVFLCNDCLVYSSCITWCMFNFFLWIDDLSLQVAAVRRASSMPHHDNGRLVAGNCRTLTQCSSRTNLHEERITS